MGAGAFVSEGTCGCLSELEVVCVRHARGCV